MSQCRTSPRPVVFLQGTFFFFDVDLVLLEDGFTQHIVDVFFHRGGADRVPTLVQSVVNAALDHLRQFVLLRLGNEPQTIGCQNTFAEGLLLLWVLEDRDAADVVVSGPP